MNKIILLTVIIFFSTIWDADCQTLRPRNRHIYGSYSLLKTKYNGQTFNSDYAASLMGGRTFFFHKNAISDNYWIGLDWMILDLSLAHYEKDVNIYKRTIFNQVEAGTHIGPSFWYSPVNGLSLNYYFRFAPSLSRVKFKSEGSNFLKYAEYWVTGVSFSYKFFVAGAEYKWGTISNRQEMKTHGPRFYAGVRLW